MLSWSQVLKEQEAGWRLDMTYLHLLYVVV